ncbi:uncharacterized protein [Argopecten irradians]|uniref:uncharacterized protein isoform X1 n=1 Tax=Argopecten irradians TaxID=31199 RepID=UPI0037199A64
MHLPHLDRLKWWTRSLQTLCFTLPSAVWLTGLRRRSQWWLAVDFLLRRLWLCTLPAAAEERFSLSLLLTSPSSSSVVPAVPVPASPVPIRRSGRATRRPAWHKDYVM